MITRKDILNRAVKECMEELYSHAFPHIKWEDFVEENKIYNKRKEGPKPYEFYYLPEEVIKDITNYYIDIYRLNQQQELLDIIEILKNYCKEPIIDKYIEGENGNSGYKGYERPDNLEKEIVKILGDVAIDNEYYQHSLQDKFFEFLDMAGKFFNWTSELHAFNNSIYLGVCPSSNKKAVIENWKKYRNRDIEINNELIKNEYYGNQI